MNVLTPYKKYIVIMGILFGYTLFVSGKSKKKSSPSLNKNSVSVIDAPVTHAVLKSPLVKEYLMLAHTHQEEHHYEKALEFFTKVLSLDEFNFEALKGMATVSFITKEFNRAIHYYEIILTHYPRCISAHYNGGLCYLHNKHYSLATKEFRKAIALDNSHFKAWCALGKSLEKEEKIEEAIDAYKTSIALKPLHVRSYIELATLYKDTHNYPLAVTYLEKAVTLQPNDTALKMELAHVFDSMKKCEKALELYVDILKTDPYDNKVLYNAGLMLKKQNRLREAVTIYDKVLKQDPSYAKAHFARAHALLALGDFSQGLEEYEWRFEAHTIPYPRYSFPVWQGESLENKTILVYAEQDISNTLQFCRYVPLLVKQNAQVVLQVQKELLPLLSCSTQLGTIIPMEENPPACDVQIPLMSLPYMFKTTIDTIPDACPYLQADPHLTAYWKSYLSQDTHLKIGICCDEDTQETDHFPFLEVIKTLSEMSGVTLYNITHHPGLKEYKEYMHCFGSHFDIIHGPLMDSAALIKNLDLVISSDTAIAHLAAALSMPTWIFLPYIADWRWLINRSDSPWYPSVQLIHCPKDNDYTGVISMLTHKVQLLINSHKRKTDIHTLDMLNTQL